MKSSAVLLRLPTHELIDSSSSVVISFGKKPAAQACAFTVSAFAERLKAEAPKVYAFYVQRPDRTGKLTA
ncbi:hypothetical protein, partial [Thioclava electrotropha]|uniref:hypothetical protein n=1 Tax=Thioclava electrotropha TaxID=1549850 RepID=UPI0023A84077